MKNLIILIPLLISLNAYALDVVQNASGTSTVSCAAPTTYSDGAHIRANDITIKLYMNDNLIQSSPNCSFVLAYSLPVGNYELYVTAYSAFYNAESDPSNTVSLNIFEPISPNAPTQLNWE